MVKKWLVVAAGLTPLIVFLAVYAPAVGLGFISDDFRWIRESELGRFADVPRLFEQDNGFYRPLVALTFGVTHLFAGANPRPYGFTNLALALLCAVLIVQVGRRLGLGAGPSAVAAGIWLLNFHGINMAVLWVSGRTGLLVTACSLAAAIAALARRPLLAVLFAALALYSKEEALLLPAILVGWSFVFGEHRTADGRRRLIVLVIGTALLLSSYVWLRSRTGAMTPATAPGYYRLTFDPLLIARNVAEYADRSNTYAAAVVLLATLFLKTKEHRFVVRRSTMAAAAIWYAGAYAITTLVPVRSSLYAVLPSVAAAIVAAEVCASLWATATPGRRRAALGAMIVVPVLCVPAYVARNERWTGLSRFSERALDDLAVQAGLLPADGWLVLTDDPGTRVNLQSAFGSMLPDALFIRLHRTVNVQLQSPAGGQPGTGPCAGCPRIHLALERGRLVAAAP